MFVSIVKCERQRDMTNLFSVVFGDWTRGNAHTLEQRKFHTSTQKNFFMMRVKEHRNRLSREVLESPFLK